MKVRLTHPHVGVSARSERRAHHGPHHRDGDVAIDDRGADEIVLGNVFVGLVGDVERAGAEHDADAPASR